MEKERKIEIKQKLLYVAKVVKEWGIKRSGHNMLCIRGVARPKKNNYNKFTFATFAENQKAQSFDYAFIVFLGSLTHSVQWRR